MIIPIHQVFTREQVSQIRGYLDDAEWVDGAETAGAQASSVKRNQQLSQDSALCQQLGDVVLDALARHSTFISVALPQKIYPPLFNRYSVGETYGLHVDNAIRVVPGTAVRVRTDLSATLFLSDPEEYEGGELTIQDKFGSHQVKLSAGDMILYPSTSLHRVEPITKGQRVSSFFWLQSMVRNHEQRDVLFDLDTSVQSLTSQHGHDHADVIRLSGIYQNLIQQWIDT
ncbi:Fe2+-dependent dioxygenase [Neptunomonas phycophila]|uniref:Fe2+-dependent dioxygenase n=1 Tax=Neptunomonas phycophila TaxID=1572645 RepID=A0AAW7XL84_9GAMM|nr:Fe2+-dependent dioxygenase [Neptunomonas phycophila]MDO6453600.1 Fe2+-dependent dioxygenase [Neptunomonas phycophila]